MVKFLVLAAAAAIAVPVSTPGSFDPRGSANTAPADAPFDYDVCLAQVAKHPDDAFEMAMNALKDGEDASAEHCAAVALISLKQYNEAARRLDKLARRPAAGGKETRAEILGQAGNAWILAGQPELASASFTAALALVPRHAEYLIDRARASAMLKKWSVAESDLSSALVASPGDTEALVLRASARRAQRNFQGASGDITQALTLEPDYPEGLVERGLLRAARGDKAGARKDFLRVLEIAADKDPKIADTAVDAARSARHEIEKLEVTEKGGPKLKVQVKNN